MEESGTQSEEGAFIPQQAALGLLEAAKEAVILLREHKAAYGANFEGDSQLEMLVAAILKAEGR